MLKSAPESLPLPTAPTGPRSDSSGRLSQPARTVRARRRVPPTATRLTSASSLSWSPSRQEYTRQPTSSSCWCNCFSVAGASSPATLLCESWIAGELLFRQVLLDEHNVDLVHAGVDSRHGASVAGQAWQELGDAA